MFALTGTSMFDHPFWGRGFRPFFFLGAIYAALSILLWLGVYTGHVTFPDIFSDPVIWHAHEMIYGFAIAIVAGFLLTAVANWTGGAPVRQLQLMGLCGLWLAGRLAMNINDLPVWLMFILELSFIPALALSLSIPLLKSWNTRNFVFLVILSALSACDIAFLMTQNRTPLYIALFLILMMISLIGGRVIPSFTVGALRRKGINVRIYDQRLPDRLALLSLVAAICALLFMGPDSLWFGCFCLFSALVHIFRMRRYHTLLSLSDPMLWILHLGYGWLAMGLFLIGVAVLGVGTFPLALHALTVGAIGSMILGMMCRVTLGHTGRDLTASKMTAFSFILMQLSVVLRILGPLLMPEYYTVWVVASGILWSGCFVLYLFIYAPMLWLPRPDRQPA
ncbi:MAG: NnrS family protein [Micavibrio sp.]